MKLTSLPFKAKMGPKQRPHFEIIDWRSFGPPPTPVEGPKTPQIGPLDPTKVGKPVKPVTTSEELNDALPF